MDFIACCYMIYGLYWTAKYARVEHGRDFIIILSGAFFWPVFKGLRDNRERTPPHE